MTEKVNRKRRAFIRIALGSAAFSALHLAFRPQVAAARAMKDDLSRSSGLYEKGRHPIYHDAERPEAKVDISTGSIALDEGYYMRPTICLGCRSLCGAVAKVRKSDGALVRLFGNPYDPHSTLHPLPYDAPVRSMYLANSQFRTTDVDTGREYVAGLEHRPSLCARGTASWQVVYDPHRLMAPLKRAGPRGSGKWIPISWEQLIQETVRGGRIFSEIGDEDEYWGINDVAKDYVDPLELLADAFAKMQFGDTMKSELEKLGVTPAIASGDIPKAAKLLYDGFDKLTSNSRSAVFAELKRLVKEDAALREKYGQKLIDMQRPEYGPKSNQFLFAGGRITEARGYFGKTWFTAMTFGSTNYYEHTNICEVSHHVAHSLVTSKTSGGGNHFKADPLNAEYIMCFGTSPGNANFPMQTILKRTSVARSEGKLRYVLIDPVLQWGASQLGQVDWAPIRPGTDGALTLGLIRWILEQGRYNKEYLSAPNIDAAKARGEFTFTDATFLVVVDPEDHPRYRDKLRGSDLGIGAKDEYVVIDDTSEQPTSNLKSARGKLDWEGDLLDQGGKKLRVTTVLGLLKRKAFEKTPDEWSKLCGVPLLNLISMARELTSHETRAAATFYRGPIVHPNGFWNALAIISLNTLIGNWNRKGGYITSRSFSWTKGRYDLTSFPGARRDWGLKMTGEKSKFAPKKYEESTEYSERGYPSSFMWYPFAGDMFSEILPNHATGAPYSAKVILFHKSDAVYTVPSTSKELVEKVRSTKVEGKKPLHIICDIYVNETGAELCDYIIPDTTRYERWNINGVLPGAAPWKGSRTRVPVIDEKPRDGKRIPSLEQYLIDVALKLKEMGLKIGGVGDGVIKDTQDALQPMRSREDFFLKAIANLAYDGWAVPAAGAEDLKITGYDVFQAKYADSLKPEEWEKAHYVMCRGGKIDEKLYDGDFQNSKVEGLLRLYVEEVATGRHPISGRYFEGLASWIPPETNDGKSLWSVQRGYSTDGYDLSVTTYKNPLTTQSKYGPFNIPELAEIMFENWIEINSVDAAKIGIRNDDIVEITTPVGTRIAKTKVREGIAQGVIAFAQSFGHWWSGAQTYDVGGVSLRGSAKRGAGVQLNPVMAVEREYHNPTDPVGGNASFSHTPARLRKLDSTHLPIT